MKKRTMLFATAMRELIERRRNRELLKGINAAYVEPPDAAETKLQKAMLRHHRQRVLGLW